MKNTYVVSPCADPTTPGSKNWVLYRYTEKKPMGIVACFMNEAEAETVKDFFIKIEAATEASERAHKAMAANPVSGYELWPDGVGKWCLYRNKTAGTPFLVGTFSTTSMANRMKDWLTYEDNKDIRQDQLTFTGFDDPKFKQAVADYFAVGQPTDRYATGPGIVMPTGTKVTLVGDDAGNESAPLVEEEPSWTTRWPVTTTLACVFGALGFVFGLTGLAATFEFGKRQTDLERRFNIVYSSKSR